MNTENKRICFFVALTVGLAATIVVVTTNNILFGVFSWAIRQPRFLHGLVEGLVCAVFFLMVSFRPSSRGVLGLATFVAAITASRHRVLGAVCVAWLFTEAIFILGLAIERITRRPLVRLGPPTVRRILLGLSFWGSVVIVCSARGLGTVQDIRLVFVLTLLVAIATLRPGGLPGPLATRAFQAYTRQALKTRIVMLIPIYVFFLQTLRASYVLDFDSIWYGLRSHHVLAGSNFFDSHGYLGFVFYYPKLFELVLLPFSGIQISAIIFETSFVFYLATVYVVFRLSRLLRASVFQASLVSAVVSCLPVFGSISLTCKPDTFSTLFLLFAAYFITRGVIARPGQNMAISLCCVLLAMAAKLTAWLYGPMLLLGGSITMAFIWRNKHSGIGFRGFEIWKRIFNSFRDISPFVLFSSIAFLGCTIRTWLLTGYPTYPALKGLWNNLDFSPKYPFHSKVFSLPVMESFSIENIAGRWWDVLFDPSKLSHISMVWPGNFILFAGLLLLVVPLVYVRNANDLRRNALGILALFSFFPVGIAAATYITILRQAGDGNYYLFADILFVTVFTTLVLRIANRTILVRLALLVSCAGFMVLNVVIMFVSHSSWQPGTRTYDFQYLNPLFEDRSAEKLFEYYGVNEIVDYLRVHGRGSRTIGIGLEMVLNRLPTRYESLRHLGTDYMGNAGVFSSSEAFREYLRWANVEFLVLPREDAEPLNRGEARAFTIMQQKVYAPMWEVFEEIVESGENPVVVARRFVLIELASRVDEQ